MHGHLVLKVAQNQLVRIPVQCIIYTWHTSTIEVHTYVHLYFISVKYEWDIIPNTVRLIITYLCPTLLACFKAYFTTAVIEHLLHFVNFI